MTDRAVRADGGAAAGQWLDEFSPDWTSLHFVPYSFDPRGLFGSRVPMLAGLLRKARRRHVHFHEVWIGLHRGASAKEIVVGWLQRRAVRRLLRSVGPIRGHACTAYHVAALASIGQPAERLPMFGSVPRRTGASRADLPGVPGDALVCGLFATLHPNWRPEPFLGDFWKLAQALGRPAALVAAGGIGPGAELFSQLEQQWLGRILFVRLGRCSVERLAEVFARFDFAVTSTPWNILGKSSSAAALREHGVKVVATEPGDPARLRIPPADDAAEDAGFVPYFREPASLGRAVGHTEPLAGVAATVSKFLADLDGNRA